jgi:hypothetical protein
MYNVVETAEKKPQGTFDRGSSLWYNRIDSGMVGRLISLLGAGEKICDKKERRQDRPGRTVV